MSTSISTTLKQAHFEVAFFFFFFTMSLSNSRVLLLFFTKYQSRLHQQHQHPRSAPGTPVCSHGSHGSHAPTGNRLLLVISRAAVAPLLSCTPHGFGTVAVPIPISAEHQSLHAPDSHIISTSEGWPTAHVCVCVYKKNKPGRLGSMNILFK